MVELETLDVYDLESRIRSILSDFDENVSVAYVPDCEDQADLYGFVPGEKFETILVSFSHLGTHAYDGDATLFLQIGEREMGVMLELGESCSNNNRAYGYFDAHKSPSRSWLEPLVCAKNMGCRLEGHFFYNNEAEMRMCIVQCLQQIYSEPFSHWLEPVADLFS